MNKDKKITNLEEHWNNKHPKQKVIYSGRAMPSICPTCKQHTISNTLSLDVRNFIKENDAILQDIIERNKLKQPTHDETMLKIQQFVVNNIQYVSDEKNIGTAEYWQFPFETIHSGQGDCEDFAILIAAMAVNCEVPEWRVRVVAGLVATDDKFAPEGGHGYCTYLRIGGKSDAEKDQWVILDGCYFPDPDIEIVDKPILKNNKKYRTIWFSFNNKFSWGEGGFTVESRLKSIKK